MKRDAFGLEKEAAQALRTHVAVQGAKFHQLIANLKTQTMHACAGQGQFGFE